MGFRTQYRQVGTTPLLRVQSRCKSYFSGLSILHHHPDDAIVQTAIQKVDAWERCVPERRAASERADCSSMNPASPVASLSPLPAFGDASSKRSLTSVSPISHPLIMFNKQPLLKPRCQTSLRV
jgi:hypothetical protein